MCAKFARMCPSKSLCKTYKEKTQHAAAGDAHLYRPTQGRGGGGGGHDYYYYFHVAQDAYLRPGLPPATVPPRAGVGGGGHDYYYYVLVAQDASLWPS